MNTLKTLFTASAIALSLGGAALESGLRRAASRHVLVQNGTRTRSGRLQNLTR